MILVAADRGIQVDLAQGHAARIERHRHLQGRARLRRRLATRAAGGERGSAERRRSQKQGKGVTKFHCFGLLEAAKLAARTLQNHYGPIMAGTLSNPTLSLGEALRSGDRRALARAITLVESTRPQDQAAAEALLTVLLPHTGAAVRIGISGAPGVGKSTFIEAFGRHLTRLGKRVAVFAVDPSSRRSRWFHPGRQDADGDAGARSRRLYPSLAGRHDPGRRGRGARGNRRCWPKRPVSTW